MNTLETLQVVATIVPLIALGFGAGTVYERRRRVTRSLQSNLNSLRRALSDLDVLEVRAIPSTVALGTQIAIEWEINSRLNVSLEVWIGADIHYADNSWFYDVAQDKVVSIEPGRQKYTRYLTVASPLPPGSWRLNTGIWFGTNSQPNRSIRLALRQIPVHVTAGG